MSLASIPLALEALRAGRPIIVADDEGRENEGDVILAAESASQEWIAWMVKHTSGFICAPMTNEFADRLELPPMVEHNEDPRGTAYTVSVDAADRLSTGISASDRAHTLRVLADPTATPARLHRPGHIMPLRAVDGGVARARRPHRGGGRSAETGRPHPGGSDLRDRRGRRRDGAPARADHARRAGERAGDHDRVIDPLHGRAGLRGRPPGGRSGARVVARHLRGGDDGSDQPRRVPRAGPIAIDRPGPTTSPGSLPVRMAPNRRTAPSSACTPSA